ncbi:MAG: hypothetical protein ACRCV9_07240 [Burkholderiaceae bacterium]
MKQVVVAALVGAAAGMAGAVAVMEIKYAPGTWFSISGDPQKKEETRIAQKLAAQDVHCLYKSERYKPGDVLDVTEAGVKMVCTAGTGGNAGQWLHAVDPLKAK